MKQISPGFHFSSGATTASTSELVQAYEREKRIAECLQRVLLRAPAREALRGLSVEAIYEAALSEAAVGGDSCDAIALDGGRIALVVADACGKGLAAAERIAEVRFALRAFLREHSDPERALVRLNDFVCDAGRLGRQDGAMFVTMTLAVLDGSSGEAVCLCAGGEPPLVLRSNGTVETIDLCGPALGLYPVSGYPVATLRLGFGDSLLLATDGITEARNLSSDVLRESPAGEFLGLTGLARLAAQAQRAAHAGVRAADPPAKISQIGRSIFERARSFAGGAFHDDACIVIGLRETW